MTTTVQAGVDTSTVTIGYVEEAAWGTTPASALTNLRLTGESLNFNISNVVSDEIAPDPQVRDLIQTDAEAAGGVNFELSYGTFDDFFASGLRGTWGTAVAVAADTTVAASNTSSAFTSVTLDFTGIGAVVGQWIKVSGFTTASNNGYFRVTSIAAGELGVSPAPGVDEVAGDAISISGALLRNGTEQRTFTLEKKFGTKFHSFTGMGVGSISTTFQTGSIVTGSLEFMGKTATQGSATVGTGAANAATTTSPFNAVRNVGAIQRGATAYSGFVSQLDFSLTNNMRGQKAIGNLGSVGLGYGEQAVTGNVMVYFKDGALYDDYLAGTETSLFFPVTDGAGNTYYYSFPRVKFTSGEVVAGAKNQDVMANMGFQALRDTTTGTSIQIDRFPV